MHPTAILLALQCTLALAIRVPNTWNENSEVKEFDVETITPRNVAQQTIPKEYFEYTAQKPKFAAEIAKFHGVQSPENHYKAYPVKPYTGVAKPELGKHQMMDEQKNIFRPFQEYVNKNEDTRYVNPSTTSYEVFHPYKLEEPALKDIYKGPVMDKIRNDLINSKNQFQKYENEAGEPDIKKSEYLESPEETDRKKFPHKNIPAPYEIHRPQRRPIYYRPPSVYNHREHVLNQKFRHPWHQNYVKVKPMHYRPVKNHLQRLRQQHALKYDDEHNEYPQVPPPEKYSEPTDGYDIYQKGKEKFVQLRNNVDESINDAIQNNRPIVNQKLEIYNDDKSNEDEDNEGEKEEDEFVPIKNYAQVRRTETTRHLPKEAAYRDADTLDEIKNAPRLREAIKSTKAQTVYSEEGYEDSAYDHAGEQKHASDHEGHGGFLKEKELSGGKYKTPTFSAKYKDGDSSEYRDQLLDGKKWKNNNKDTEEDTNVEEYSENEQEHSEDSDVYNHKPKRSNNENEDLSDQSQEEESDRTKREEINNERDESSDSETPMENTRKNSEHDVSKREATTVVPEFNLNTTYLTEKEILRLSKLKILPKKDAGTEKYPYYMRKLGNLSKHSPLRYAENLRLIPQKSEGGTEFYDSRSKFECPEVDDNIDPIPEKLKKGGHPDDENEADDDDDNKQKSKSDIDVSEEKPRLTGLGDKIDCFKAKYFGENPLDSPFFKEEIISNPEPVTVPSNKIYKFKQLRKHYFQEPKLNKSFNLAGEPPTKSEVDIFTILDKLSPQKNEKISNIEILPAPIPIFSKISEMNKILESPEILKYQQNNNNTSLQKNNDKKKLNITVRKRRAAPFIYEPYKIIKDSQIQDSKKTTTTNNISPLIKQLQSSRVATNQGKDQVVKRNVPTKTYKDIGKNDRDKNIGKGSMPSVDASFVDVSVDPRRGEPRYELRSDNHKKEYTPVENKTSMTKEEYKSHTSDESDSENHDVEENKKVSKRRQRTTTPSPYIDISKFLPRVEESDKEISPNENIRKIKPQLQLDKSSEHEEDSEEDYEEYDDETEESPVTTTTTKAPPRKRISSTSTTVRTKKKDVEKVTDAPRLRLVTRFRNSYQTDKPIIPKGSEAPASKIRYDDDDDDDDGVAAPKYREKKKKSSKSTLVTDTKSYGEDDDDELRREEVDALIGVKQDIKEYMPRYEKEERKNSSSNEKKSDTQEDDDDDDDDDDEDDDHHGYGEDDRIHEHDDDDDDEESEDDDEDDDNDDKSDEFEDDESKSKEEPKILSTTPEPTKRTLARTTEAPLATTEARSAKLEVKPIVLKKKIEIHKELPVNRSSPHITEFKQDIKELEIIKEIPPKTKKIPLKNIEALELYKDENLAKDVNKLGGVEIFKEGLDISNGPKHGGNYRNAEIHTEDHKTPSSPHKVNKSSSKADVIASQSKTSKLVEVKDDPYSIRKKEIERARNNRGRSAKLIELRDSTENPTSTPMHGGNLKSIQNRRRGGNKNAKLIELDDHNSREDHSADSHDSDFRSYGSRGGDRQHMHGGNYRSAKIVQPGNTNEKARSEINKKERIRDGRRNAAALLSSFASAVPVLTTTPAYILDPSKRMYYYVDA